MYLLCIEKGGVARSGLGGMGVIVLISSTFFFNQDPNALKDFWAFFLDIHRAICEKGEAYGEQKKSFELFIMRLYRF
jgi:hypothetical protein